MMHKFNEPGPPGDCLWGQGPRYTAVGSCGHAEVCWICAVRLGSGGGFLRKKRFIERKSGLKRKLSVESIKKRFSGPGLFFLGSGHFAMPCLLEMNAHWRCVSTMHLPT